MEYWQKSKKKHKAWGWMPEDEDVYKSMLHSGTKHIQECNWSAKSLEEKCKALELQGHTDLGTEVRGQRGFNL